LINFKSFLVEETQTKNKIPHIEDHVFHDGDGHENVGKAANFLDGLHDLFRGKKSDVTAMTKYDSHPVTFGRDKKGFHVSSDPSIKNYSKEEIDKNYASNPQLATKLKAAHEHLAKIAPDSNGTYDGKMFTGEQISSKKGRVVLNGIGRSYSVPADSAHGQSLKNAKMAVVVEAKHNGRDFMPLGNDRAKFKQHPDVHQIDPTLKHVPGNYTPDEQQAYLNNRKQMEITYAKSKPEMFDGMEGHNQKILKHINDMSSQGLTAHTDSYLEHIKGEKNHGNLASQVISNRKHFDHAFMLHGLMKNGKNILAGVMHKNEPFTHHDENGEPIEPRGALIHDKQGNFAKLQRN
jgi:hypothetical protein